MNAAVGEICLRPLCKSARAEGLKYCPEHLLEAARKADPSQPGGARMWPCAVLHCDRHTTPGGGGFCLGHPDPDTPVPETLARGVLGLAEARGFGPLAFLDVYRRLAGSVVAGRTRETSGPPAALEAGARCMAAAGSEGQPPRSLEVFDWSVVRAGGEPFQDDWTDSAQPGQGLPPDPFPAPGKNLTREVYDLRQARERCLTPEETECMTRAILGLLAWPLGSLWVQPPSDVASPGADPCHGREFTYQVIKGRKKYASRPAGVKAFRHCDRDLILFLDALDWWAEKDPGRSWVLEYVGRCYYAKAWDLAFTQPLAVIPGPSKLAALFGLLRHLADPEMLACFPELTGMLSPDNAPEDPMCHA